MAEPYDPHRRAKTTLPATNNDIRELKDAVNPRT